MARLLPVAMLVAAVGMMAFYFTSGATTRSPMFMFFPVMMLMSVLGTVAYSVRGGSRTAELNQDRRTYLRYLDELDADIEQVTAEQHRALWRAHPEPGSLWSLVGSPRMWERERADDLFCCVRIGVGDAPLVTALRAPDLDPVDDLDPVTVEAMRIWVERRSVVTDVPVVVPLTAGALVTVEGDAEEARAVVRAMLCQVAVLHAPGDVTIAAAGDEWDWLKWLPHHQRLSDDCRTIVVVDGADAVSKRPGATVLTVVSADAPTRILVDGMEVTVSEQDSLTRSQAATCARRLAPHRASRSSTDRGPAGWLELMGLCAPGRRWSGGRRIRPVPIGVDEQGMPVHLDINEASRGGMGPHGLCVGATGSGKSEFLRTLTLGMVAAHPPEALNLVLVDFKGGATFSGLDGVRHVAAVITNLADEAHLVARMNDALAGELTRRQELLRAAGSFAHVGAYEQARAAGAALPPLPVLFVVVDEFSELLSQHSEFADLFLTIGRLGRSLGVHLLLASQRLDEGRLRGLETHLSYRICLKTFSASESRAVLGVPEAYQLPSTPGAAYLKVASGDTVRLQTAYVSGPYAPRGSATPASPTPAPHLFTAAMTDRPAAADREPATTHTVFDAVVREVAGHGTPAHPVWLPPLRTSPALDDLLRDRTHRHLSVPVGLIDNPYEQRRDPLLVELDAAAGNVAIVGAPRSGKSTALRTLIRALAETHSPAEVGVYCLDFGGGSLDSVRDLPHVGAVAGRHEAELCRRTVAVVESMLRQRERRAERAADVFLVIDGWATLRAEFDGLEAPITAIAARGLSFGVHVMLTASRWAELRPGLKDQIGTRIELRLGDPAESEMDRKRARQLGQCPPGHGLTAQGREFAIAVAGDETAHLRARWDGRRVAPVELLPTRIGRRNIPSKSGAAPLLGLGESDLAPVTLDFARHSHLLVLGETGCGKTSLLRLLCRELLQRTGSDEVQIEIVDFRRTLLGVVESDHLAGYTPSPAALTGRVASLLDRLRQRMPGEDVTQQQLRARSWWSGPDIYLVIDDYDLVAASTGNPLAALADLLPYAADLGLHVIVARRSGGAARAMFDPVLARLREMGCAGLMMSASPDEGVLLGSVRPSTHPPGRGTLVVRGEPDQLVQVAWSDPV